MSSTFLWYDFETTGIDPVMDRPLQFAGVRTDTDLNSIGEPVNIFCSPGNDVIPIPDAILVTGLSMLELGSIGETETEFCREVLSHMSVGDTCVVGYNSMRFDDEFTRQMCYRNFYDPYVREWRGGNSRWDVIDMLRMAFALRPEGIDWPMNDAGLPSFRLEALTAMNGIEHSDAHDAVADVNATIELTRLLRDKQPKLYKFLYGLRQKSEVLKQLYPLGKNAIVHVSSMYSAGRSCIAVVLPICSHPANNNGVICYDLSVDPEVLVNSTPSEISRLVFTSSADLEEGEERIPLKTIHINRCPAVAPLVTLGSEQAERLNISLSLCQERVKQLQTASGLVEKVSEAFSERKFPETDDPDRMLYQGSFFGQNDKVLMEQIHNTDADQLDQFNGQFDDPRLDEMLFRYRARNSYDTLAPHERERWNVYRQERWRDSEDVEARLETLLESQQDKCLLDLKAYVSDVRSEVYE
ncbi:MAG TPA: exodeoxyribonuclease I [Gammaproteobacteria bacterium]|nr:exodeoxyribonuclease I [Gammaproteobacteria bacterium]